MSVLIQVHFQITFTHIHAHKEFTGCRAATTVSYIFISTPSMPCPAEIQSWAIEAQILSSSVTTRTTGSFRGKAFRLNNGSSAFPSTIENSYKAIQIFMCL